MKNPIYQVRARNTQSETFEVVTGLKQDTSVTLSPFYFNIALEKIVLKKQNSTAVGTYAMLMQFILNY